jgi:hypothetical protein
LRNIGIIPTLRYGLIIKHKNQVELKAIVIIWLFFLYSILKVGLFCTYSTAGFSKTKNFATTKQKCIHSEEVLHEKVLIVFDGSHRNRALEPGHMEGCRYSFFEKQSNYWVQTCAYCSSCNNLWVLVLHRTDGLFSCRDITDLFENETSVDWVEFQVFILLSN